MPPTDCRCHVLRAVWADENRPTASIRCHCVTVFGHAVSFDCELKRRRHCLFEDSDAVAQLLYLAVTRHLHRLQLKHPSHTCDRLFDAVTSVSSCSKTILNRRQRRQQRNAAQPGASPQLLRTLWNSKSRFFAAVANTEREHFQCFLFPIDWKLARDVRRNTVMIIHKGRMEHWCFGVSSRAGTSSVWK